MLVNFVIRFLFYRTIKKDFNSLSSFVIQSYKTIDEKLNEDIRDHSYF